MNTPNPHRLSTIFATALLVCSSAYAATIRLDAPADGAVYDLPAPCVKEFLEHFEERGVKPPRPPLSEAEIAQSNRQHTAYRKCRVHHPEGQT